jgi:hypothetical protein
MRFWTVLLFLFIFSPKNIQAAKLYGTVLDEKGEALPFANVLLKGGGGTTANINGDYQLELPDGAYEVVFQYIGYAHRTETVTMAGRDVRIDVALSPEDFQLEAVTVDANAEDPAYRIIRAAIAKRSFHREQVNGYACQAYVKGIIRLLDAPERLMGQNIGNLEGTLDTNRKGILYLSESVSKYSFERPDRVREEMISSKVSGDDNGFSFNTARGMEYSFYDNQLAFNRPLISPIADDALFFYRYKLEGSYRDEASRLIHKIAVLPKREMDPVFRGYIYLVEEQWNIHSTDLWATQEASKVELVDSLVFRQLYQPVREDLWMPFSRSIRFAGKVMGFAFQGDFVAVYRDYEINPVFPKGHFTAEVMKVEESANQKDEAYWSANRPVPLTVEEERDYLFKDSLAVVRASKEWLDSVDRENNRFRPMNLLTGYTYNKSYQRMSFTFNPLSAVYFNTVQGYSIAPAFDFTKAYDDNRTRLFRASGSLVYGFDDRVFRGEGRLSYRFNRTDFTELELSGGRALRQFNADEPITPLLNSLYCLLARRNYMKVYDKHFVRFEWQREVANGLFLKFGGEWAQRTLVENRSNTSYYRREGRYYRPNIPGQLYPPGMEGFRDQALLLDLSLRIRFKQRYMRYPDRKLILGSDFPELTLQARSGLPGLGSDVRFLHLSARLGYDWEMGLVGNSELAAEGGFFPWRDALQPMDFQHFNGNQTLFANARKYMNTFQLLDYYRESTTDPYVQVHYQHFFNGFLFNKIPLFNRLGFTEVVGYHFLYVKGQSPYMEFQFGIDKIGWKIFRFLRVDWVMGYRPGRSGYTSGVVVGFKF